MPGLGHVSNENLSYTQLLRKNVQILTVFFVRSFFCAPVFFLSTVPALHRVFRTLGRIDWKWLFRTPEDEDLHQIEIDRGVYLGEERYTCGVDRRYDSFQSKRRGLQKKNGINKTPPRHDFKDGTEWWRLFGRLVPRWKRTNDPGSVPESTVTPGPRKSNQSRTLENPNPIIRPHKKDWQQPDR